MADTYAEGAPPADTAAGKTSKKDRYTPEHLLRCYWREIERYDRATTDWRERGENVVKIYLGENKTAASPRRFALLWSNVETLKPAVYAKTPVVVVSRRFRDPDPVGRIASEILERATNTTFDLGRVDETLRMVRDDRLLPGRGQAWVRYEADFETVDGEAADDQGQGAYGGSAPQPNGKTAPGAAPAAAEPYERVIDERVVVDHVHWCDFGHNLARTWADVWLVWRRVYKDRDEVEERFDEKIAEKLVYTAKAPEDKDGEGTNKAVLYELWDKKRGRTVFISKDCPHILEDDKPPLRFRDFFPCPEPCLGTRTSSSLIPKPDYSFYRDQAEEIDDLTAKIGYLTEWLVLRGFVPGGPSSEGADAIQRLVTELKGDNLLIQVESWAGFTEKGGAARLVDWLPIDIVVQALREAVLTRAQLVQDVFQITGISDILRGQSDPDETLGAQEIKTQTGSRRVRNTKDEIARFARDIGCKVAEVIAEVFQPQTIAEMTGFEYVPSTPGQPGVNPMMSALSAPAQMGAAPIPSLPSVNGFASPAAPSGPAPMPPEGMPPPAGGDGAMGMPSAQPAAPTMGAGLNLKFDDRVMKLLRNDRMRGFVLDIETDSTVQPDEDAEKQRRTEFLTAVGAFMQQAMEALTSAPALAPAIGEMLMFTVRGFRAGRSLEDVIERSVNQLAQQLVQPKGPSPEEMKAQADVKAAEQKMQSDQLKMQTDEAKAQFDAAVREKEMQHKERMCEMEYQQAAEQHALKMQQLEREARMKTEEHARKMELMEHEAAIREEEAMISLQQGEEKHERDLKAKREDRETIRAKNEGEGATMTGADKSEKQKPARKGRTIFSTAQARDERTQNLLEQISGLRGEMRDLQAAVVMLAAPKEIIRGPDGKAIGVRSVMQG